MFCSSCGTENEEGALFCKNCGKSLGDTAQAQTQENKAVEVQADTISGNAGQKQFSKEQSAAVIKRIIIACVGVLALIVIISIFSNARSTINLNKYVTVDVSGYDGYGRASVSVDWDAIEKKYGKKISYKKLAKEEYGGFLTYLTPVEVLGDFVDIELSDRYELSNGDVINYSWDVSKDLSSYLKVKVKYKDGTYKVSGLQSIDRVDAFADLVVSFDGKSPDGRVSFDYSGADFHNYDFKCDKTSGLRNGETVKIYLEESQINYYAENLGKVPRELEREFIVEGLDEYADSFAKLPDEFIATLKKEAEDTIYAYIASSYSSDSSMDNLSYAGYIMDHVKEGSARINYFNDVYLIYTGIVSSSENKFPTTIVYFPVQFTNIMKSADNFSFENNLGIIGSSNLGASWWYSTKGYTSPVKAYISIEDNTYDNYEIECGDGFEIYSEYEVVDSLSEISDAYKTEIQNEAKKVILNYIETAYNGGSTASELQYVGDYLLKAKNEETYAEELNHYYVVFSSVVSNSNGYFEDTTVYYPVQYKGIMKLPNDKFSVLYSGEVQGYSYLPDSYYTTNGYVNGEDMYSDIVTAKREKYTYEVSDGLSQFGN